MPSRPGLRANINHRITDAFGLSVEHFAMFEDAESEHINERIAFVAFFKHAFAAHGGHAKAVAVVGNAANDAFQNVAIACAGFGIIEQAEADRIHNRDRASAHSEDVAQNAPHTCSRALKRLNKTGVIVRFDFECNGDIVTDIDDPGVFARPLQDVCALGRQLLQVNAGAFIRAVFAPHHAEDTQLRQAGFAAQEAQDLLIFVWCELVRGNNIRRDFACGAHDREADAPACANACKIVNPSVPPIKGSATRSGCGIIPITFLCSFKIPAMLRSEPFGLSMYFNATRSHIFQLVETRSCAT